MLKFIKSIFDNWAEGQHRGWASWPELLTAFLVVQTHDGSGGPRHRLPGFREWNNVPEGVHFFSVLGGNVRHSYFPIIRGVWIVLRLVLVRESPRGLWRHVSAEDWSSSEDTYLDLALYLLLSACFLGFWIWNPRFIEFICALMRGGPRFNIMPFMRVRVLFRSIWGLLRRLLG